MEYSIEAKLASSNQPLKLPVLSSSLLPPKMPENYRQGFCGCGRRLGDRHCCQFNHSASVNPVEVRRRPNPQLIPAPGAAPKKRAVVVGISYRQTHNLKSSVDAARSFKAFLTDNLGFPNESIRLLTDDQNNKQSLPTKANMLNAMRWLVENCRAGDSLVFYFSGYATQVIDDDDDEEDGYDEALCPLDYEYSGKIRDDVINATIVRPLPRGVKLHAFIDTDYCGTVLDLPLVLRMNDRGAYGWENQYEGNYAKNTNGGLAVSITACDDAGERGVGDISARGKSPCLLTSALIQVLQYGCGSMTYPTLLNELRSSIRRIEEAFVGPNDNLEGCAMMNDWRQYANEPQLSSNTIIEIDKHLVAI